MTGDWRLTFDQQRRYARQIMLPEMGEDGQRKLLAARVLVVGAGGLGSPLITYLAAAGVGHLGIIDPDRVELSNLPRQIAHETGDIGRLKVESASDRMAELNPDVTVTTYPYALDDINAEAILRDYDIIADGCDHFGTRFLVNATCVALGKPLVTAAIAGWDGQLMTCLNSSPLAGEVGWGGGEVGALTSPPPHPNPLPQGERERTPCYQCVVSPDAPDANTCRESGIMGPLAGQLGTMQALEVVRTILGTPAYAGRMAVVDGRAGTQRVLTLSQDTNCLCCGTVTKAS